MIQLIRMVVYGELVIAGVGLVGILLLGMVLADRRQPDPRALTAVALLVACSFLLAILGAGLAQLFAEDATRGLTENAIRGLMEMPR